jgi:hypothetical protein
VPTDNSATGRRIEVEEKVENEKRPPYLSQFIDAHRDLF